MTQQVGGAKPLSELKSPWAIHVHHWRAAHPNVPYREAVKLAKATYVKGRVSDVTASPVGVAAVKAHSPWVAHVKAYQAAHPGMSYKTAMSEARGTYAKGSRPVTVAAPVVAVAPAAITEAILAAQPEIKEVEAKIEAELPVTIEEKAVEGEEMAEAEDVRNEELAGHDAKLPKGEQDKAEALRAQEDVMRKVLAQMDKDAEAKEQGEAFHALLEVIYDYIGKYTGADFELWKDVFYKNGPSEIEDREKVVATYKKLKEDKGALLAYMRHDRVDRVISWIKDIWEGEDRKSVMKLTWRPLTEGETNDARKAIADKWLPQIAEAKAKWEAEGKKGFAPLWRHLEDQMNEELAIADLAAKGMHPSSVTYEHKQTPYGKAKHELMEQARKEFTYPEGHPEVRKGLMKLKKQFGTENESERIAVLKKPEQWDPRELAKYRRGHLGSGRPKCGCGRRVCNCARAMCSGCAYC